MKMMCEESESPIKAGAGMLNSSASSNGSLGVRPFRGTWAKDVQHSERQDLIGSLSVSCDSSISTDNDENKKRDISLEFMDGANEEKFERLLKQEKLKTAFKRRHSKDGNCVDSPNSSGSDNGEQEAGGAIKEGSNTSTAKTMSCPGDGNTKSKDSNYKYKGEISLRHEGKRLRHNSFNSTSSSSSTYIETDVAIVSRRQKQIDYGKNTTAYDRYIAQVPRSERSREHPQTPNKYGKYSRRAFDGLIKIWRKQLHYYDEPSVAAAEATVSSDDSDSD